MSFLRAIIAIILTLVLAGFAALNTEKIEVVISPVSDAILIPLYAIALGAVAFGFVSGALMVWINGAPVRKDRRKKKKAIRILEKEVDKLKDDKFTQHKPATDIFPAITSQK